MIGQIVNGKYVRGGVKPTVENSSQYKNWSHDSQRADHQWELLQPYKDGKPNDDFIEAYPEEAKTYGMIKEDDN